MKKRKAQSKAAKARRSVQLLNRWREHHAKLNDVLRTHCEVCYRKLSKVQVDQVGYRGCPHCKTHYLVHTKCLSNAMTARNVTLYIEDLRKLCKPNEDVYQKYQQTYTEFTTSLCPFCNSEA